MTDYKYTEIIEKLSSRSNFKIWSFCIFIVENEYKDLE